MRPLVRGERGSFQSEVSILKTSSRQPFDVLPLAPPPPRPPPVLLSLQLLSPRVVAGHAAVFVVSAAGTQTVPSFVFDAGDGTIPRPLSATEFTHVYQRAGRISASVWLPPGIDGRGASVSFEVVPPPPEPIVLALTLTSPVVVAGEPASFAVSVEGVRDLPEYLFNPGDGSPPHPRHDATFTYVYPNAGHVSASVILAAGFVGTGSSVAFDVVAPQRPIALMLQLASSKVVTGETAMFIVTVQGGGALPEYIFNAGDRSAPELRRDGTFTHVYPQSGQFAASVSLPPGAVGTGSSVIVDVSNTVPPWVYVAIALLAVVGAYMAGRARRGSVRPHVVPTLHSHPRLPPSFDPARPRGIRLEVHFVPNLAHMHFTPRVLIRRED